MANLEEKLQKIKTVKGDIKASIEQVGGKTLTDEFDTYPQAILDLANGAVYTHPEVFDERTNGGKNLAYLYYGATLPSNAMNNRSYPNAVNSSYMFSNITFGNTFSINNWNVPNLKTMDYMFSSMKAPTGYANAISMYGWNCQPTSMKNMCANNSKLQSIRFGYDPNETSVLGTTLDTSKVKTMKWIFSDCGNLIHIHGVLDLSSLSEGLYCESAYNSFFYGLTSLQTVYFTNIYKDCTITNEQKWSVDLYRNTKLTNECILGIINALPTIDPTFTNIWIRPPQSRGFVENERAILAEKNWTIK